MDGYTFDLIAEPEHEWLVWGEVAVVVLLCCGAQWLLPLLQ